MEYLAIEVACFLILFFVHRYFKLKLFQVRLQMLLYFLIVLALGSLWDNFAVYRDHWNYAGPGLVGITIGLIPIEDYLFMIVVAYALLLGYALSQRMVEKARKEKKKLLVIRSRLPWPLRPIIDLLDLDTEKR